ncbi:hypothetical protein AX15_003149 [Amanita polypyramis BW_CC]|nr:hypothetical protein AX15_003149 [Amanita polypyramis BW_CC]
MTAAAGAIPSTYKGCPRHVSRSPPRSPIVPPCLHRPQPMARFVAKSRPTPSLSSHRLVRRTSSSAPIMRILGKQHRMTSHQKRVPLANKAGIVNRRRSVSTSIDVTATPALTAPAPVPTTSRVRLPRTLPRPALREIDMTIIEEAFPDLKDLPPQYIRDKLAVVAPHMLAALRCVQTSLPNSTMPAELEAELIPETEEARANPPTHYLAVYGSSSSEGRTKMTLFPSHQLVFSSHCANLPALPSPPPSTSETTRVLPVVPVRLPVPTAFPLLYAYLYTKSTDILRSALAPEHESDVASLTRMAALIQGIWQNTCVLGVVDRTLYDTLDYAWGRVMTALESIRSS